MAFLLKPHNEIPLKGHAANFLMEPLPMRMVMIRETRDLTWV